MNLSATMDLKAGAFLAPLQTVRTGMAGAVSQLRTLAPLLTGLGGAFAAFKGTQAIVENFFKAFEKGHELEKLSRITGQSVRDLVILQKMFGMAGVDAGGLQQNLVMLQKSLGGVNEQGEPTKHIFDQLGLSIENLQKLAAPEQIEAIGTKIRALPNATQRTAAAMAVFGRAGAEMLAVLDDPDALKEAKTAAATLGSLYQRNAKIFSEIVRTMNAIKGKVGAFFAGVAEGAAPAFKAILAWVKQIDLAKMGRDLGQIFRAVPAAIEKGRIGELLQLTLNLAFAKSINFFTAGMTTAFGIVGDLLSATFANLGSIGDVLIGAAAQFGAALLNAVQKPLAYLQAFMENLFDGENAIKRDRIGEQAKAETNAKFGVTGRSDLTGRFGALTRTPEEDVRLQAYNLALEKRTEQLEKEAGTTSITDRANRILKEGGPRFGFGGASMNANEIGANARENTKQALTSLRQPLTDLMLNLGKTLKGFKIEDVAGAGGLSTQLGKLLGELLPKATSALSDGSAGVGGGLLTGGKAPKLEGDRLSRIGGFIGGAGGPSLDYARRSATATEKLVDLMRDMRGRFPGTSFPQMGDPLHGVSAAWR